MTTKVRDSYLNQTQLAKLLGVTDRTLQTWQSRGYIKPSHRRAGFPTYYRPASVAAAIRKLELRVDPDGLAALETESQQLT